SAAATTTVTVNDVNQAPIASVSAPLIADERTTLTLDGTGSSDPDGNPAGLTYQWTTDGGGALTTPTQATTGSSPGEVPADFTLLVCDTSGACSAPAGSTVNVSDVNRPPAASAGAPQTVNKGDTVVISAAGSTDPDGDSLTYAWTQTGGPAAPLSSATAASPV